MGTTETKTTDAASATTKRVATYELSSGLRVAVARLSRRVRAEKADDALSDGQFSVLALLFREGPHTLGQLSEHERVTPPSMNRRVNALVQAGYVEREPSPTDGRKVLLRATAQGAALVNETRRRRDEWLYRRLARLPADQRHVLHEASTIIRELADS
ncbi:MAG TPA: MarR family transcriptional regulator [Humibacter sp.]|nr:MarR family transcriptional regulator [Humibacter sp.]